MIRKILVAEDHESVNISLNITLKEIGISDYETATYCDDALLKIQKSIQEDASYDLLITDLYFEKDHREVKLSNGMELIKAARDLQPDLKVLVFSAEHRPAIILDLYKNLEIDGFVRKARGDAKELKKAFECINDNQQYYSSQLLNESRGNTYQFSDYDIKIVEQMVKGMSQKEIAAYFKEHNIQPSGQSSIEKRINGMKAAFNYSKNEQIIAHCVKWGIVSFE